MRPLRCPASFEQEVRDGEGGEEDECAELVYARGAEGLEDGGRSQEEAENRSPHSERRVHGQSFDLFGVEPPAEAYMRRERYDPAEK